MTEPVPPPSPETPPWTGRLLVVGTGLIGTSVGLAVTRAGGQVHLHDRDRDQLALAASLGAGEACPDGDDCARDGFDLALAAVPPAATPQVVTDVIRRNVAAAISHVSSVQTHVQHEVETQELDDGRFVGGHPIAGRETTGPAGADPDLFTDRSWAVCPTARSSPEAIAAVVGLARATGAVPVQLGAEEHDRALARLSHVPQLVASALAATLLDQPDAATLAGSGFRDTTRLADSPADMWRDIVTANRTGVLAGLDAVLAPLLALRERLAHERAGEIGDAVGALMTAGHRGRALLPGKHGRPAQLLASVLVVIPDEAGALARLFADIAEAAVNVEDLRVEHAAGQPRGVIDLAVAPAERDRLLTALAGSGWAVVPGRAAPL